ncbi:Zinc finger A20 and AN1 domain-containing stress-associated protein 5 [Linum perenne]
MCQNCFTATTSAATTSSSHEPTSMMTATASIASTTTKIRVPVDKLARSRATRSPTKDPPPKPDMMSDQDKSLVRKEINRWCGCRRKVGLTGFRCRCGELFCWLDISGCVQLAEVSGIDKLKGLIV